VSAPDVVWDKPGGVGPQAGAPDVVWDKPQAKKPGKVTSKAPDVKWDSGGFSPSGAMRGKVGMAGGVEKLLSGPLAPFLKTTGKIASPVLNFMNRGAQGLMSVAGQQPAPGHEWDFGQAFQRAGPTVARALAGNESPEQYAADTASMKEKVGLNKLPDYLQPAASFGVQTFFDPLMHTGPLTRTAHSAIEAGLLPTAMKLGSKLPEGVQKFAGAVHTMTGVDAPLKRYLAANFPDWMDKYAGFYASRAAAGSAKNTMEYAFTSRFKNVIHGMSESDQRRVFMHLDGRNVRMTPELEQKAAAIKELTDTEHYLKGDQAAHDMLAQRGFVLPKWAERFDPSAPRDIAHVGTYREHYVPTPKKFKGTPAKPKVSSSMSTFDPSLLQRKNLPFSAFKDVSGIREGFGTHFGSGARVIANTDLENQLRDVFHLPPGTPIPDPVLEGFQKAVLPEHLQPPQKPLIDAMRTGQDIDKTAMFSTPTRHMMNVGNLAAMADPASIPGGLARYAKTALMKPEARSDFFKKQIAHGAVQIGQIEGDRGSRFAQLLTDTGQHLQNKATAYGRRGVDAAIGKTAVGLAGKAMKLGGSYFKAVGDQLWKFDDALKASQFDRLVKQGMTPDRAGLEVNASMVDYNTASPLADSLRAWAPFITWRSKFPLAVGRSMLRNPGNVNMLARAFPQAAGENVQSNGQDYTSNLPLADVMNMLKPADVGKFRALKGPMDYLRGTMGTPMRAGLNAGLDALMSGPLRSDATGRKKLEDWFTYGQPTSKYAQSQIPIYGQTIQPLLGQGLFGGTPMENLIYSQTGVHKVTEPYPLGDKQNFLNNYRQQNPNATVKEMDEAYYQYHLQQQKLKSLLRRYEH
jgi:hypothetical protein